MLAQHPPKLTHAVGIYHMQETLPTCFVVAYTAFFFFKQATLPVFNLFHEPVILWSDPEDEGQASGTNE